MPCSYLIVDPDRNFREALAIALRLDGHEAVVAESAADGAAALQGRPVGWCLVDAHLQDAEQVLAAAERAGVRVVMTGPYADVLEAAGRRHPTALLLAKPIRPRDLTRHCGEP